MVPVIESSIEEFCYPNAAEPALHTVDLQIHAGEFVLVTGPAASAKTTLLYCLSGIIPQFLRGSFKGAVKMHGVDVSRLSLPQIAAQVGFLLQQADSQLFCPNVAENVAFGPENLCLDQGLVRSRVANGIALVGMNGATNRMCDNLSGGETQRIALASVFAMDAAILMMDQPASHLDPDARRALYQGLHRMNQKDKKTIVVVDDRLDDLLPIASRVIEMRQGRIVQDVPAKRYLSSPSSHAIRAHPNNALAIEGVSSNQASTEGAQSTFEQPSIISPLSAAHIRHDDRISSYKQHDIVQVRDLSFKYPQAEGYALKEINLTLKRGELAVLLGPNGAGKTTLAKHLIGLLRPTRGTLLVNGRDIANISTAKLSDTVGYLFQDPDYQLFCNTVFQEVAFGLNIRKQPKRMIEATVANTLERVGLSALAECHPYKLSQGQRQRLALASVLARQPTVLVLDEPTARLTPQEAVEIMEIVADYKQTGTILVITHDVGSVGRHADRAIEMRDGLIIANN